MRIKVQKKSQGRPQTAITPRVGRSPTAPASVHFRAAQTNDLRVLPGVDGRSLWARRFRDVIDSHLSDLGGESRASEGEKALIRRSAALVVELERRETKFAEANGASDADIEVYQRSVNTLRRCLETLATGLARRSADTTPPALAADWSRIKEVPKGDLEVVQRVLGEVIDGQRLATIGRSSPAIPQAEIHIANRVLSAAFGVPFDLTQYGAKPLGDSTAYEETLAVQTDDAVDAEPPTPKKPRRK